MALVIEDIKYFLVISETNNMTRASEKIGISQPALSYAIKRLEKELGADLLIRLKNGIRLTKIGESFLLKSRKLILEWEEIQNLVDSDTGLIQGSYSFAIHPSVALFSLGKILPKIAKAYPQLNIELTHGLSREMCEKVINWEADFGIVVNPIKHADLVIKKLCTDKVTLFGLNSKNHETLICDSTLSQTQSILKNSKDTLKFKNTISSKSLEVVAQLASKNMGHAILPSRVAAQYPNLKAIDGAYSYDDEICLIYRPEKGKDKVGRKIIDIINNTNI